jgi:hypothetical protein
MRAYIRNWGGRVTNTWMAIVLSSAWRIRDIGK